MKKIRVLRVLAGAGALPGFRAVQARIPPAIGHSARDTRPYGRDLLEPLDQIRDAAYLNHLTPWERIPQT